MSKITSYCYLRIVCADLHGFLDKCLKDNIVLEKISYYDSVTITCKVQRKNYNRIATICHKYCGEISIESNTGIVWTLKSIQKRLCLIAGLLILVVLTAYLPTRVLFIQVEGNTQIPTNKIIEAAENCGIGFGASRNHVRSEKAKNMLLQIMPQLQWAGINTSGCIAIITVKERAEVIEKSEPLQFGNIVAQMDGVITDCTVEKGKLTCRVGQAVQKGQVLVSGYMDNGLSILATKPEAEINAMTNREIELVVPIEVMQRVELIKSETKYSLQIGKKLINFDNSSGISDTTCVKIYDKQVLTLPGGFKLPVSIVKETREYYSLDSTMLNQQTDFMWAQRSQMEYLQSQMIAGKILSYEGEGQCVDNIYCFLGKYFCQEMIGQYKLEEIMTRDE